MAVTPNKLGFFMPAEWEKHSAVWLAWPYDETTFPGRVERTEDIFVKMIFYLHTSEQVELLVLNEKMKKRAAGLFRAKSTDLSKINFHITEYADVWIRDYGPVFLCHRAEKTLAWVKWQYNAYGKGLNPYYTPLLTDNLVFNRIQPPGQKFETGIVLEGGAIEVNGQGVCLTTEQCLLNENRNPGKTKEEMEKFLNDYLGVQKTIWLKQGLTNDHTDGHIDELARFVASNKIVCAYEDNESDENYQILKANYKILKDATDQKGQKFELIKLPMPHMNYQDGRKAPASYANFYIGNSFVLVPTFKDKNDQKALEIVKTLFPGRLVLGIDSTDLIYGGGTIHCVTQQQPAI